MRPTLLFVLILAAPAAAQPPDLKFKLPGGGGKARSFADVADLTTEIVPAAAKPGQTVAFRLTITPKPGCWTYPANPPVAQDSVISIALPKSGDLAFVPMVVDPDGWKEKPNALNNGLDRYYPGPATWELKATVMPSAGPGEKVVTLTGSKLQACNDNNCFPYEGELTAKFTVLPGDGAAPAPPAPAPVEKSPPAPKTPADVLPAGGPIAPPPATPTRADPPARSDLLGLLAAAVFWGFVSLITPCVFPMIPITVSLFLKQSNQTAGGAVKLALVYSLTIIAVLGSSAVFLLSVFQQLSINPYTNMFLGGLFVVFALSLFGMYDITLPGFLLRATERRRGAGGMVGTVFGALAFSIVSFTCVAPFLGGFAGMTASQQYSKFELVLAGIAFATAFATPFFVLALFPSLLKRLPRSGGWLDTVKAVMGFLELAAALKFFRTAELVFLDTPQYFTYDVCLVGWVAISAACGLYLLNLFRLPHDEEKPSIGVPRLVFAVAFLGLALYLLPGVFRGADGQNQRPGGVVFAWVDSFLLPDPHEVWARDLKAETRRISNDLAKWEANGRSGPPPAKRLIFVDFTGVTCTNCRLNERNVFPRPEVKALFAQYTLVQLYTDTVPAAMYPTPPDKSAREAEASANQAYQKAAFGTIQLPLYVILEPQANGDVKTVGVYDEGKINDVAAFVEFLRKPLEAK